MNTNSSEKIKSSEHQSDDQLIQVTTYVILLFTSLIFITGNYVKMGSWQFYTTILLFALILIANIFWRLMEDKLKSNEFSNIAFIVFCVLLSLSIAWIGKYYNIVFMIFMITAQAFIVLRYRIAAIIIAAFVGLYLAIMWMIGFDVEGMLNIAIALVVGLVFVITLSIVLRRYAEQTERSESLAKQLQLANQELVEARQKEKELAVAEERVRLARDIHDGLGHHLTALNIQLQAAQKMFETQPEKSMEAIQICRQEAKAALDEIRHSVAIMRRSPLDGKSLQEALRYLVGNFEMSTGQLVDLDINSAADISDRQISDTVYRTIQEGLTNIQKHARQCSKIKSALNLQDNFVDLEIEDNGLYSETENSGKGFGLAGIRERAELMGGSMSIDIKSGQGFKIYVK
ncbi:MAG: sensor histidine kinase, partial [Anaerolineaceae bacterium]|nr:sensor histidine kinase [Anaerolineaceae bacterium]